MAIPHKPSRLYSPFLAGLVAFGGAVGIAVGEPPHVPEAPPVQALPGKARPEVERLGDGRFRLGNIEFNQKTREIAFDAKVNMNVGFLEYVLVHGVTGKIHESLLSTEVSPLNLNIVLLLLDYKASSLLEEDKDDAAAPPQPKASLDIVAKWTDSMGKKHETFVENWVYNVATDAPAVRSHWLYTGSKVDEGGGFAAETDGSLIALYRDHRSVINNPREGKLSDEIWKPAPGQGLPEKETPVRLFLRPHIVAKS